MTNQATSDLLAVRLEILPGLWLDARLALWLAAPRLLVVADLHWGYAASHRAQGNLLPAWGDTVIAQRLGALIADYAPREMLWLGDSLHTLAGRASAEAFLAACTVPVTIVAGNHDARWSRAAGATAIRREQFFFHHGNQPRRAPADALEIIGHHHPAISWSDGAGARLKLPALVASARRLVLPAFSPWAAGVPWEPAAGETIYAIGRKRIFAFASHRQPLACPAP
ncbi:MAG TPA: metallophosphoesterase [Opitutus sp.]|nr:metallophosphoesterase [Opitutus sp.]